MKFIKPFTLFLTVLLLSFSFVACSNASNEKGNISDDRQTEFIPSVSETSAPKATGISIEDFVEISKSKGFITEDILSDSWYGNIYQNVEATTKKSEIEFCVFDTEDVAKRFFAENVLEAKKDKDFIKDPSCIEVLTDSYIRIHLIDDNDNKFAVMTQVGNTVIGGSAEGEDGRTEILDLLSAIGYSE